MNPYMSEKELALKYHLLNSQMSPHFINNTMQCICKAISEDNYKESLVWLQKLSKLTKIIHQSVHSKLICLTKEIEISKLYLELQQEVFGNPLLYTITISERLKSQLDTIKVPPMILQPLIENAIIHGLQHILHKEGQLNIRITSDRDFLNVIISDNGTGISKPPKVNKIKTHGVALKNINERINIIDGYVAEKQWIDLVDIKDGYGNILGAKSSIKIPLIQL